jgi:hypothetical protein
VLVPGSATTRGDRPGSTLPPPNEKALAGEALFRRAVTIGMALFLAVAAFGLLGPLERTASVAAAPGQIEVSYPGITRPGLDSEITLTLRPSNPTDSYRVRIPQEVLAALGVETISPEPSSQVAEGDSVVYVFDAARHERVSLTWSGRVPTKQAPARLRWSVAWLGHDPGADPAEATEATLTTWVLP